MCHFPTYLFKGAIVLRNRSTARRCRPVESLESRTLFAESAVAAPVLISTTGSGTSTVYNYNISLKDTGTTPIGTLWYAWVPGEDFLTSMPTAVSSPTGWNGFVTGGGLGDGYAIRWTATGVGVTPGQTLTGFKFSSADSPTVLAGKSKFFPTTPVGTSFVYSAGPFSDLGYQFVATPATPVSLTVAPPPAQSAKVGVSVSIALGSFKQTGATAPYAVAVKWGDGSADTKFLLTAAGSIPPKIHTFIKATTDSVTVTVTDAAGHASNAGSFNVAVASQSITGSVFADTNANGKLDPGEKPVAGVKVFIDANKSGSFLASDLNVTTNAAGLFTFANLSAGTYRVREVLPPQSVETTPIAKFFDVILSGSGAAGLVFGNAPTTARISGTVFNDSNTDGKIDNGELGLGLWQVFIDANKDGKLETTEKVVTTDLDGKWSFTGLTAGTYTLRVVPVTGTVATKPTGGVLTLVVNGAQALTANLFGEKSIA